MSLFTCFADQLQQIQHERADNSDERSNIIFPSISLTLSARQPALYNSSVLLHLIFGCDALRSIALSSTVSGQRKYSRCHFRKHVLSAASFCVVILRKGGILWIKSGLLFFKKKSENFDQTLNSHYQNRRNNYDLILI